MAGKKLCFDVSRVKRAFYGAETMSLSAPFIANVNSRSRSLYAIARPTVVGLSSVTFVRPTQLVDIFGNISMPFGTSTIR